MFSKFLHKFATCNFSDKSITYDESGESAMERLWSCEWTIEEFAAIVDLYVKGVAMNCEEETSADDTLRIAISLMLVFVQHNFVGPFHQLEMFRKLISDTVPEDLQLSRRLKENGVDINSNIQVPELLIMAKDILKKLLERFNDSYVLHWWQHRFLCVHQTVLDELANSLYEELIVESNVLLAGVESLLEKEHQALVHLEVANGYLLFNRPQKADEVLLELYKQLNINIESNGMLGRRTKFQQVPRPQLSLNVTYSSGDFPSSKETNGCTEIPKLILLDDDTRLEQVEFLTPIDDEMLLLPSALQALLLSKVQHLRCAQAQNKLMDEEMEPYIRMLLNQEHGPLQIRQTALLLNCKQECGHFRTVERSLKQCEEVWKNINGTKYTITERLSYAFVGCLQPKWKTQMQLCDVMMSLGMTKSVLDIALDLKAWDLVITCYTKLNLHHKAAEVIRSELEKKPTVLLYCLLGDILDDASYYEKAWTFSNNSSGLAQCYWGNYHFQRKEYDRALPHLEMATKINSLQERVWLQLGYAALQLGKWLTAVDAYIRCTHINPSNSQSWNNLATALIKMDDMTRAHKIMREGLKCDTSNWKAWENFLLISVSIEDFNDALQAYERISELKNRYLDKEILRIIVAALVGDKHQLSSSNSANILSRAAMLLDRLCTKYGNEWELWEMAASLARDPLKKSLQLTKAYSTFTRINPAWASNPAISPIGLRVCRDLCQYSILAITAEEATPGGGATAQLKSARLSARACIRVIENAKDCSTAESNALLVELKNLLDNIEGELKQTSEANEN